MTGKINFKACTFSAIILFLMFIQINAFAESKGKLIKELFDQKCSKCHDTERPLSVKKKAEDWVSTVNKMRAKDPSHISEEEAKIIAEYLSEIRGIPKEAFQHIENLDKLTEIEKLHSPVISANWDNITKGEVPVTVKIGENPHPMKDDHFIVYIEIFVDFVSAGRVDLKPGDKTEVEFKIKIAGGERIVVRTECNKHGKWEASLR